MREKVLLADDVEELANSIGKILKNNNYEVDIAYNGKEALEKAIKNSYDVIILDVMMPIMSGMEVIKEIREKNIKTPVILLTAKSQVEDKVEGLDAGANDYLTKPFDKDELLARIRVLTRTKEESTKKYRIGNVILDKENSKLLTEKTTLRLNNKECELMEFLIKSQGRNINEEELKQRVWLNEENTDSIVPMYISYLQEKFMVLGANIRIKNNDGYTLEKLL